MIPAAMAVPSVLSPLATKATPPTGESLGHQISFSQTISSALGNVSQAQSQAQSAEMAVAEGKPGASTATALVMSDRAEIDWTGVVAVRNELVSAYQTLSNMQI